MPSDKFYSKRLTLEETTNSLENIVNMLKENMDDPIICFTVSPIRHFRDEFEWHINNPECLTRNYGIAHYADPLPVVEKQ